MAKDKKTGGPTDRQILLRLVEALDHYFQVEPNPVETRRVLDELKAELEIEVSDRLYEESTS